MTIGGKHFQNNNFSKALEFFLTAWDVVPDNLDIITVIAQTYSELGDQKEAMNFLEKAFQIHGTNETLLTIMGKMAADMSMHDTAEKLWRICRDYNPSEPSYCIYLSAAMTEQEKYDEAIEFLIQAIESFPQNALLWNRLGVAAQMLGKRQEAVEFYKESARLDPNNYQVWSNFAHLLSHKGAAIPYDRKAIELNPNCHESHVNLALSHFLANELQLAWPHYEHRLSPDRSRGQAILYDHDFPRWNGEELSNKTIFVRGEQGIGDEVFFAKVLPDLYKVAKQVIVACDPRLVKSLERMMPNAIILAQVPTTIYGKTYLVCDTLKDTLHAKGLTIDYFSPFGSLWPLVWDDTTRLIRVDQKGYLTADPDLSAKWKERVSSIGQGLKIGISWSSGNKASSRVGGYTDINFWHKIASLKDVHLIQLQYDECEEDIHQFEQNYGQKIHRWSDVDLKRDIENNLAIMDNLDLVMGPGIATQMFSIAKGTKTYQLARQRPWWNFGIPIDAKKMWYAPNLNWVDNPLAEQQQLITPEGYNYWAEASHRAFDIIVNERDNKLNKVSKEKL